MYFTVSPNVTITAWYIAVKYEPLTIILMYENFKEHFRIGNNLLPVADSSFYCRLCRKLIFVTFSDVIISIMSTLRLKGSSG